MTQTTDLTTVHTPAEEIEQYEPDTDLIIPANSALLPVPGRRALLHLQFVPEAVTVQEKLHVARMLSDFTQVPPVPLTSLAGEVVEIVGAIIYEQIPYTSKKTGEMVPGYLESRLHIIKEEDVVKGKGDDKRIEHVRRHIIARTSGMKVQGFLFGLLPALGWYDWEVSIKCEVIHDVATNTIYLHMVD